jgi:hypothetical protein
MFRRRTAFALSLVVALKLTSAFGQDQADLAKAAQNPVAAMISLPFQNNTLFVIGPDDDAPNLLNIQPVIRFTIGDWNIINRTIAPVIYLPDVTAGLPELPEGVNRGSTLGLGDINHSVYFSPADSGPIIWGIGPSLTIPTATDENIGSEKWSAGPAAVVLAQPGPWVIGSLVRQLWSFAGDGERQDVSQLLIQPFCQLQHGGRLVSGVRADHHGELGGGQRRHLDVPLGGGFGRICKIGNQAINAQIQGFYNVEHPQFGPEWIMRFQLQFLFPT